MSPNRNHGKPLGGAFGNFKMGSEMAGAAFDAEQQYKSSLCEVLDSTKVNSRIFTNATKVITPPTEYLNRKRGSIFQKNVELNSIGKFVAPVFEKSQSDTENILKLLQDSFLTKHLTDNDRQTLANAMKQQHFEHDELIIKYGAIGDKYFVLSEGTVKVKVYEPGSLPSDPNLESLIKIEKQLSANPNMIGFGEIALLMNDKRTASVIAQGSCSCWVLSADVFKNIIAQNTLRKRSINLNYLNQVNLFKKLEIHEKMKLIDGLEVLQVKKGEFVFHEGEIGNQFFIIEEG